MLCAERLIQLSFPMSVESPVPPAIRPLEVTPRYQIRNGGDANVYRLAFDNHSNTHVDAPAHVVEGGLCIEDFTWRDLIYLHPAIIDLSLPDEAVVQPEDLAPHLPVLREADILLVRFGYGRVRREQPERYINRCPGFGVAAAEYLRAHLPALRAIGLDVPSLACIAHLSETMGAHHVLLQGAERRFLIIEDMDLEADLGGLVQVLVVPWLVTGVDSVPCAVLGLL